MSRINGKKSLKTISIFFGVASIFLYFGIKWLSKSFGNVTFEQLLWNMSNTATGVDINILKITAKYIGLSFLLSVCWVFFVWKFEEISEIVIFIIENPRQALKFLLFMLKRWCRKLSISYVLIFFALLSISFFCVQVHRLDKHTQLGQFISSYIGDHSEDFIEKNIYFPNAETVTFATKKDLVVVLAESLETSFYDPKISTQPLESQLKRHLEDAIHLDNMRTLNNSGWTIAAMTGWHFGLPLKLPPFLDGNSYHSKRGFLPGAKSIFEILEQNGYTMVMVLGSDSNFSGKRTLFTTHGGFRILDKQYWQMQGWSLEENGGTGWGYDDRFVLDRAYEEYKRLKREGKPFVLFVETVDTHAPDGYAPKNMRKYGDIRDAFVNEDELLDKFADDIKGYDSSNTALAIIGDHNFMGNPPFLPDYDKRRLFNMFWSSNIKNGVRLKEDKNISALDIAPTLLELAGGRWENRRYGLGVSVFSEEPTLLDHLGFNKLNHKLAKRSKLYNSFY